MVAWGKAQHKEQVTCVAKPKAYRVNQVGSQSKAQRCCRCQTEGMSECSSVAPVPIKEEQYRGDTVSAVSSNTQHLHGQYCRSMLE